VKRVWAIIFLTGLVRAASIASASDATISSDELELQDNAEVSIFKGHVILKQDAYEIHADRMVRTKKTGIVHAVGHVVGRWISEKGEKVRIEGDSAVYQPVHKTVDVDAKPQVSVFIESVQGNSTFHGDRGWADVAAPGKARLMGHVTGHVIPAGAA